MESREETLKRVREEVESHPIVLFMKGNPSAPQCGFSARVVQVLEGYGVSYRTVDVLADPAIREGVKEYGRWPTVPQLYVKGELVGGCDIIDEMHQSGELASCLSEGGAAS